MKENTSEPLEGQPSLTTPLDKAHVLREVKGDEVQEANYQILPDLGVLEAKEAGKAKFCPG